VPVVRLEHPVRDFETWKAAFDGDPVQREASGVRRYQIYRPIDDANYIAVDLEFDDRDQAEAFKSSLEALWQSAQAAPALGGKPQVRIVDVVETKSY
jgi:quinol monooxygenase YgiN